ncbi:hypothetical protein LP316_09700 [Thalassotalea sp. LPB0316]|uniref:hypothetical protein n=1 Tax=Thalassotalea sp. LPB0316 TaxID=2769490 RepID=UPI001868CF11|nr:hypothetical protein [Thalassotalea sp. LPB0316]QOL24619.1 hypothetical protein LP316_09700 [Thalassotalea sp. LPB0316]
MKPLIILSAIAIVAATLIYLTIDGYREEQALKSKDLDEDNNLLPPINLARLDSDNSPPLFEAHEQDHLLALHEQLDITHGELMQSAWHSIDNQAFDELEQHISATEYQAIELNQTMYLDISVGTYLTIELPMQASLIVQVTAEQLEENGDFTWQGEVIENGKAFPVKITQSEFGTYGTIETSKASYTVTSMEQGVGVIYKNPLIHAYG